MKRGFNHLGAVQRSIPGATADIVEQIVIEIAGLAAATAPIDTGALAESYTWEVSANGEEGVAGSNMEYAPYVEYGTVRTPAQPHLVPAAERAAGAISIKEFRSKVERKAKSG